MSNSRVNLLVYTDTYIFSVLDHQLSPFFSEVLASIKKYNEIRSKCKDEKITKDLYNLIKGSNILVLGIHGRWTTVQGKKMPRNERYYIDITEERARKILIKYIAKNEKGNAWHLEQYR
jgi:hypothetical protein